ncbi:MAG TPA: C-GCAxxG-C-C family protein [Soehngenia sp.]|nr:C-GCAxxG-C-C family protein [Soehngenia sp.]HPP32064.1 C-GCAxxG-C-C family protein [Soehngenia sp.]
MTREELINQVKSEAEGYFQRGEFFCSEAVVRAINNLLGKPYEDNVVKMASGFPIGIGKSGCLCGAVSGGIMALGMVYGRNYGEKMDDSMFPIAAGLHDFIKDEYGSTCCRVMTRQWAGDNFQSPERKKHCVEITGKVAEWIADKLIEDGKVVVE